MTLDRQTKGGPGSTAAKAVALLTRLIPKRPGGGSPLTAREYVQQWHAKESKRIAIVLTELQERKDKLVEAFVYRQAIDQDTYRQELDKLNEEITLADMAAHDAKLEAFDAEAVLNFSEHVLTNAARLWAEFTLEQKQRLQRVLFPEGVTFSECGFRTTATNLIFNLLQQPQPAKASMATPAGFEPALPP